MYAIDLKLVGKMRNVSFEQILEPRTVIVLIKNVSNLKFSISHKPKYLYVNVEQNEQGKITIELNILFTVSKDKGEFSPKKLLGDLKTKKKKTERKPPYRTVLACETSRAEFQLFINREKVSISEACTSSYLRIKHGTDLFTAPEGYLSAESLQGIFYEVFLIFDLTEWLLLKRCNSDSYKNLLLIFIKVITISSETSVD